MEIYRQHSKKEDAHTVTLELLDSRLMLGNRNKEGNM